MNLSRLADLLEMQENQLLNWLISLPDNYGFVINDDLVEFNSEDIDWSKIGLALKGTAI